MRVTRRLVGPMVVGLLVAGFATAAYLHREPAPLPPLTVQTLSSPTGIALPERVVSTGDAPAYSFSSPAPPWQNGGTVLVELGGPPAQSSFGVLSVPLGRGYWSLDDYTDWQRRNRADSHMVGEPVVERSALGAAVRKDLQMTAGLTTTQWAVEHDGNVFLVEWMHRPDDDTWRPTVEAMIASWQWG